MVEVNSKVGVAFALTIGAGLATALGASIVFFPRLVQYANRSTLASALGFSAGIMTYVSFIEIFQKSIKGFQGSGYSFEMAYKLASFCFFGGVFLMLVS
jgi:zinc transporter, ZIP family